mgnify:CR=1 FL=1
MASEEKSGKSRAPRWPYLISLVAVILDQWTKKWFLNNYELYESRELIPGIFSFTRTFNTGAAFSLFKEHPGALTVFAVVVFGLMVVFRDHLFERTNLEQTAFGLIAGGVVGNITDRMQHGHVIDFLHWHGGFEWPIFNLADSFICIGVGLYFVSQFIQRPKKA